MSIVSAVVGSDVNASVRFLDIDDEPVLDARLPVTYRVFDMNGNLVLTNSGIQDSVDRSLFTCSFTLPSSAKITEQGQTYRLQWSMTTVSKEKYDSRETFTVTASGGDISSYYPKDVVVIPGYGFFDRIALSQLVDITDPAFAVEYKVITEQGCVSAKGVFPPPFPASPTDPVITAAVVNGAPVLTVTFTAQQAAALGIPKGVQQHFMGNWYVNSPVMDGPEIDAHPIYVITSRLQMLTNALYKMLSNGILQNVEPYLTWNAGVFAHHAIKGFEVVNNASPRVTAFSIDTPFPVGLTQFIEKAGMVSALRAQLMAYQNDWDFQGAGVQLNVNRSGSIEAMISQLQGDLDKVDAAKRNWLNSGRPVDSTYAALTSKTPMVASQITLSDNTNWVAPDVPFDGIVPAYLMVNSVFIGGRGGRNRRL